MASLLSSIGSGGREYVLKIVADVTDAVKGVEQVGDSTKSFKDKAIGIGKGVATGLAVAAVAEFGRQVVDAGVAADEAMDMVSSVFGDAGNDVIAFSKTVADKMGLSSTEYMAMAGKSGQAMTQMGISQQDAAKRTETMAQRAADLAAIFGGDASEAMNAFDKAMIGQTKGLKKYNIVLDKSEVEARALAEGYVGLDGKATDAGKAIAAQELILEKTSKQAGAYAENSGDLAAQQERLAAKFENIKATLAEKLLPAIEKIVSVFEPFIDFIAEHADVLAIIATAIGTVVVAIKAWEIAQLALNLVLTANPIGLIVVAVGALVAAVIWAYNNVEWFHDAIQAVWEWIQEYWPLLLAALTGPIGAAVWAIIEYWDEILAGIQVVWDWIKENWPYLLGILTGPFGLAIAWIVDHWSEVTDFFYQLPGKIQGWLSNLWNIITDPFKRAFSNILEWAKGVGDWFYQLPGKVQGWLSGLFNIIKYPFEQAFNWVKDKGQGILDFFRGIPNAINNAFSGLFNIIKYPFEQAFNAIKTLWNNTVGRLSFTVPSWVPGIGGKGWSAPRLAAGGIVSRPTLALIGEAGPEAVIPLNRLTSSQANSEPTIVNINVYALNPTAEVGRLIYTAIRDYERTSGNNILNSPAIPSGF